MPNQPPKLSILLTTPVYFFILIIVPLLMSSVFGYFRSPLVLSPEQKLMYASEKEENFRWILKIAGSRSSYTLSSKDIASPELQQELSDIGQFAEVAHGSMRPEDIWKVLPRLLKPGFPLEGYKYLEGSELIEVFHGNVALVQGYVAYRPQAKQLIVAFSGTSSSSQALSDVKAWHVSYPGPGADCKGCSVHAGFWDMYSGVRGLALDAMRKGLESHDVSEIVLTAHSMGAVMVYLLMFEILDTSSPSPLSLPAGVTFKIAVFGSPRVGNKALRECWRKRARTYQSAHGAEHLKEWSVRNYQDGVPAMPNSFLGYRHLAEDVFYLYHGKLYYIPPSEREHTIFTVTKSTSDPAPAVTPDYPLGGHNYYGGRDMEKLQRLMRVITEMGLGRTDDWEDAFLKRALNKDGTVNHEQIAQERWWHLVWRVRSRRASSASIEPPNNTRDQAVQQDRNTL